MTAVDNVLYIHDVRWQCPQGHFVAERDIHEEDFVDTLNTYYGIRTETSYLCHGVEFHYQPRLVEVSKREWSTQSPLRDGSRL